MITTGKGTYAKAKVMALNLSQEILFGGNLSPSQPGYQAVARTSSGTLLTVEAWLTAEAFGGGTRLHAGAAHARGRAENRTNNGLGKDRCMTRWYIKYQREGSA